MTHRPMPALQSDALIHNRDAGLPRLLEIMRRLRDKNTGCPWDIEQDFDTIAPYTIEESYEVADVITRKAWDELPGELGDLLLNVIYHAQMADEAGLFDFSDVVQTIGDKMLHRHPHVFGAENRDKSAKQQVSDWEAIKAAERAEQPKNRSALDGVATGLPALTRAIKLQNRAARVGFDWPEITMVVDKITEEAQELAEARESLDAADIEEEFGDLMFVMTNLARHLDIDPEKALRAANTKFIRRFTQVEQKLAVLGKTPETSDLAEMDALWDAVKIGEKAT
ncbi:MAG: nucleoside triphosphate pyrophosphohydrolase [Paracoccaceae bacterium]